MSRLIVTSIARSVSRLTSAALLSAILMCQPGAMSADANPDHLPLFTPSSLQSLTNSLDEGDGASMTGHALDENLDILERAGAECQIRAIRKLPGPTGGSINSHLIDAVLTNDMAGNRPGADAFAELIEPDRGLAGLHFGQFHYRLDLAQSQLNALQRSRLAELLARMSPAGEDQHQNRQGEAQRRQLDTTLAELARRSELTESCFAAIKSGDRSQAMELAERILSIYKSQDALTIKKHYSRDADRQQNLFATVLNIARAFSDRGWLEDSGTLLRSLRSTSKSPGEWPLPDAFIESEMLINKVRSASADDDSWNSLIEKLKFFDPPKEGQRLRDFNTSEKLRRLALSYYLAGEKERAQIFIDRALSVVDCENRAISNVWIRHTREGIGGDRVMLEMVAGSIYASKGDFVKASQLVDAALKGPLVMSPAFGAWLGEIVSSFISAGKLTEAEALLMKARSKDVPKNGRRPRTSSTPPYQIDYLLALVLAKEGKTTEAGEIIESSIELTLARVPNNFYLPAHSLAGDCALAQKNLVLAAERYEQAGASQYLGSVGLIDKDSLSVIFFKKALDCVSRSANPDANTLARLHRELAEKLQNRSPAESIEEYQKALSVMPDTDSDKAAILTRIINLQGSLREQQPLSKDKQREMLEQAARLAERQNPGEARTFWMRVANFESAAGDYDRAIEHARRSIETYRANDRQLYGSFQCLLCCSFSAPLSLDKAGKTEEAESLLRLAADKVKAVNGTRSHQAMLQLGQLFRYYIGTSAYEKSATVLDEALACDLSSIADPFAHDRGILHHSPAVDGLGPIFDGIGWLVRKKELAEARKLLDMVLKAQTKAYSPRDGRLFETLRLKSRLEEEAGDMTGAAQSHKEAFGILLARFDESQACAYYREYLPFLRKQGEVAEVERLEKVISAQKQAEERERETVRKAREAKAEERKRKEEEERRARIPDPTRLQRNEGESESSFQHRLASAYERSGNIEKAVEILLGSFNDPSLTPMRKAQKEISLAQFYVRHGMIPGAEQAVQRAGKLLDWNFPEDMAGNFDFLFRAYTDAGLLDKIDIIVDKLIENPNKRILKLIDPLLRKRIASSIKAGNLNQAEELIRKRVRAVDLVPSSDSNCDWRIMLSEHCLAGGKETESKKIFDQVLGAYQLSGRDTDELLGQRESALNEKKEGKIDLTRYETND